MIDSITFVYAFLLFNSIKNIVQKRLWRCFIISNKELLINDEIKEKEVRVIDSDGSQLGILSVKDAQKVADDRNLDLVKIAPQAIPPVCRIMDYGKYKFEKSKKEKESKKKQDVFALKEISLTVNIGVHDFETKANHAIKFLKLGDKVKASVKFRGREMTRIEAGREVLDKLINYCAEYGAVEKPAKMEGRNMVVFISSKPNK